ncbi:MAG TPA: ATP-binding protein [Burkholderiales bacterium]|nr:ATP-binding protein [Burkholderiales bacterium]
MLALVGILPLAATSGIGLYALVKQQRAQAQQSGLEVARALATAVDAALSESVSVLEALATSVLLDAGKPDRFYSRATRVMSVQPDWLLIHLADPSGSVLLNTSYSIAQSAPPIPEKESFDKVVTTLRPIVGYVSRGPDGSWGVPVRVPVVRNGKLRFVLTGVVKPDAILEVVNRQQVPQDWVVSVFDTKGMRVARSRAHEKYIGTPPASGLQELMASGDREGAGVTHALEGDSIYAAYSRASDTGWTVAIGIPTQYIEAGGYRSLVAYGGGILLSLGFAVFAAVILTRSINRPIRELAGATRTLGWDELLAVPATDIREIEDLAKALKSSAADAKEARQQAETASRAKDEFLAMLGHELRNPLAPIVTALHLMKIRAQGVPDRERDIIERQVGHLSRLVNDLLDISRITRGKVELKRERIDLRTVVERGLEMTQPALEKRTRPIDLDMPSQPVYVFGDTTRLTQVLGNLVANAARHTPGDGRIAIRVGEAGGMAEMVVEDSGSGISPELLHRLFTLFTQGEQSIDRRAGGLGLGLAIVKALVELHGGTVSASSKGANQGSTFTIRLPKGDDKPAIAAGPESKLIPAVRRNARILVVDDNADAAETLAVLLRNTGYDVRTAAEAEAAFAAIESWRPELAVLDIGLPGMNGYKLANRIRLNWQTADLKLIALTGYGRESDSANALKSGFDVHLAKPAEAGRFLDEVAKLLGDATDPPSARAAP